MRRNFDHIRTQSFQGKRYRIDWQRPDKNSDGECDHPESIGKRICICPNLPEFELLVTALHESDHASYFNLDEPTITTGARDKAKLLWRMGFRLQKT